MTNNRRERIDMRDLINGVSNDPAVDTTATFTEAEEEDLDSKVFGVETPETYLPQLSIQYITGAEILSKVDKALSTLFYDYSGSIILAEPMTNRLIVKCQFILMTDQEAKIHGIDTDGRERAIIPPNSNQSATNKKDTVLDTLRAANTIRNRREREYAKLSDYAKKQLLGIAVRSTKNKNGKNSEVVNWEQITKSDIEQKMDNLGRPINTIHLNVDLDLLRFINVYYNGTKNICTDYANNVRKYRYEIQFVRANTNCVTGVVDDIYALIRNDKKREQDFFTRIGIAKRENANFMKPVWKPDDFRR